MKSGLLKEPSKLQIITSFTSPYNSFAMATAGKAEVDTL